MDEGQATESGRRTSGGQSLDLEDESMGELALALSILRQSRGWSQHRLAKESGVNKSALSHYEHGRKVPELRNLRRIVQALGYEVSTLERIEDFLRELKREGLREAWEDPEGRVSSVPARIPSERRARSLRDRARRTADLMGQAATSALLLHFDILIGRQEGDMTGDDFIDGES